MGKKKTNNLTIKIVAVFFAATLWLYVMNEENPIMTKPITNVKVELLNEDALAQSHLQLMEAKEVSITVEVTGRRNEVMNISEKDIVAQADLDKGYKEGKNKIPLQVFSIIETDNLEVSYPKEILLELDGIIEKQMQVKVKTVGSPAEGYSLGNWQVKPSTVLIRGPRTLVNSVSEVVATIEVGNAVKDISTNVPIAIIDGTGKQGIKVEKEPKTVDVIVPVLKVKTVKIEPEIEGSPLSGYEITNVSTSPSTIKIKGPERLVANITTIKTDPIKVDYFTWGRELKVPLVIPDGIELIGETKNVSVKIDIEEIKERTFEYTLKDIIFRNLDSQLKLDESLKDEKIIVTIQAIESEMRLLSQRDIRLYIDARDLKEGTHNLELDIIKPPKVELINVEPSEVKIIFVNSSSGNEGSQEDNDNIKDDKDNTQNNTNISNEE